MSKDVRRLFAAQKAAKAASSPASTGSGTPSLSSTSKRVTHPLAKYDPHTLRLTCAICGPGIPIRSDSLWNAHLVSKPHQEAVAKLRAVKEQMQRKEAEAAERQRLQLLQKQSQQQQQGVKRKATGGLVAYADDSESEDDNEDDQESRRSSNTQAVSDTKRVKIDAAVEHDRSQVEQEIEDEEDAMAGLPAGFFDASDSNSSGNMDPVAQSNGSPASTKEGIQKEEAEEEAMEGVLPSGFFDDPEQDARVRAEVGGATTDLQQRKVDAEFKALQADLARDFERQEQQEAALRSGLVPTTHTSSPQGPQATNEHIPYEEKVELEEQEVEESILARSEEEYLLFVEMQERLEALKEKKERLVAPRSSAASSSTPSATHPASLSSSTATTTSTTSKPRKQKSKSILELVREQEKAKREKERLAADAFARLSTADDGDRRMAGDEDESDEDDEDIEAMMDWRARRV
ncbi:hypothetical protein BGZ67_003301 [Mortierella alpina]|nr:hypothetical protein BGZ67_003301 [Mortierella alpina]